MTRLACAAYSLLLLVSAAAAQAVETYSVTELPSFGSDTFARSINSAGEISGWSGDTSSGLTSPFLYSDGTMTHLGTLGSSGSTWAHGVNSRGQVVGASTYQAANFHAVLWSKGSITDLGTLGGANSAAIGINNRGEIAGSSTDSQGHLHAVLWHGDRTIVDLGMLPPTEN